MLKTLDRKEINYKEIMLRKIKNCFIVIHTMNIELPIGTEIILEKMKITVIFGTDIHGKKQLIGIYNENKENTRYWLDELENIKKRGLEKVLYAEVEENKRLEQAIKLVYNAEVRRSINTDIEKIAKYTQYRWTANGERELVGAYLSETIEEYEEKMNNIREKYKENKIGSLLIEEFDKNVRKKVEKEKTEVRHLFASYNIKRRLKQNIVRVLKEYEEIKDLEDLVEKRKEVFSMFDKSRTYSKESWNKLLNIVYKEKYEEIKEYI